MYNKKGKINKPVSHTSWRNKGFYFEDCETPKYENKNQLKKKTILQINHCLQFFYEDKIFSIEMVIYLQEM